MKALTPMQNRIFECLSETPNTDVEIAVLFTFVYGPGDAALHPSSRDMQQRLGPHITKINRKLKKAKIRPGLLKRTYRLETKPV